MSKSSSICQSTQKSSFNINSIQHKLKQKQNQLKKYNKKVAQQIINITNTKLKTQQPKPYIPLGGSVLQKKHQNTQALSYIFSHLNKQQQIYECQQQQSFISTTNKPVYEYHKPKQLIKIRPYDLMKYYPPSCSGYAMTYCQDQGAIYIYGGISCENLLDDGIKTFFYKYHDRKWQQVKTDSIYCPLPRYGHTLICYQRDLVLFGGVSQYKQKLRDRCFYSDISVFNTAKNQWRIIQTTGNFIKTRKNHAATMIGKNLFIYGGINENQEIIQQISWINYQQKKPRWKSMPLGGRFNHKMISIQVHKKQFLAIFGGRNKDCQIVNMLKIIPVIQNQSQVTLKDPIIISHQISARQMPIFQPVTHGFIIFGGINQNNQIVNDSWFYNADKQNFEKLDINLDFKQLRGAQGVAVNAESLYLLATNSKKYRAIELDFCK